MSNEVIKKIAGLPVIVDKKLVGILTNRDIRFLKGGVQKVREVMTKEVVTGNGNLTVEQALSIMNQKKIEKLPLVDDSGNLVGLIPAIISISISFLIFLTESIKLRLCP